MSGYVLDIWEQPANQPWPSTPQEVGRLVDVLRQTQRPQNAKFVELVRRLVGRYPDLTSPEAEEMQHCELAWSGGPLSGKTDTAVYSIGLALPLLDEVGPFVIEQATALGLNVFDPQVGDAFLANGRVLELYPAVPSVATSTSDEDAPKGRDLLHTAFERLVPFMEKHGFKPRKSNRSFIQRFAGGWHVIRVFVEDWWPRYADLWLGVSSRMDAVSNLVSSILVPETPLGETKDLETTVLAMWKWLPADGSEFLVPDHNGRPMCRITRPAQIDGAIAHLQANIEAKLLPMLEKYKTIEGMDALINTTPIEKSPFFEIAHMANRHIVTAYLARNPRLDAICAEFLSRVTAERHRAPILRCIEYLRRERARQGVQSPP